MEVDARGDEIVLRDIARHFGFSIQCARNFCQVLHFKGYINMKSVEVATKGKAGRWDITLIAKTKARSFVDRVLDGGK